MDKMAAVNQLRKKMKKRQPPLRIVYITNPIKFNTSASQFRALVQELTGRYAADTPPPDPNSFSADDGGGEAADDAVKVAARDENDIHVALDDEVTTPENYNIGHHPANSDEPVVQEYGSESDPSTIGLYNDMSFFYPQIFHGLIN